VVDPIEFVKKPAVPKHLVRQRKASVRSQNSISN
jgi:hypothetical protein